MVLKDGFCGCEPMKFESAKGATVDHSRNLLLILWPGWDPIRQLVRPVAKQDQSVLRDLPN